MAGQIISTPVSAPPNAIDLQIGEIKREERADGSTLLHTKTLGGNRVPVGRRANEVVVLAASALILTEESGSGIDLESRYGVYDNVSNLVFTYTPASGRLRIDFVIPGGIPAYIGVPQMAPGAVVFYDKEINGFCYLTGSLSGVNITNGKRWDFIVKKASDGTFPADLNPSCPLPFTVYGKP